MNVHINRPMAKASIIQRSGCPTCERRTYFVGFFYEWYGWDLTCLACGDRWGDGEMLPRPFKLSWREENKESARRLYRKLRSDDHL